MQLPASLSALEQRALTCFAGSVRTRFGERVVTIQLFGSRARGQGRDDSDLDVFVAIRGAARKDKLEIYDLAFDVGFEYGLTLSPLVTSSEGWRPELSLAQAIQREGVLL